eukprot:8653242-Lingulodinium_polyedra.AAC.1
MPILSGRLARSCSLNFVERFLAGANVEEAQAASDADADLNEMVPPGRLQQLADHLRVRLAQGDTPELRAQIQWLQKRRDTM